jgi:hypothetical protein
MTYSAKQRLLEQKNIAHAHLDTVSSEAFLRSAEAALLDMVMHAPTQVTEEDAAANYHRIVGARDYLQALLAIAEPPQPPKPKPNYGLERTSN